MLSLCLRHLPMSQQPRPERAVLRLPPRCALQALTQLGQQQARTQYLLQPQLYCQLYCLMYRLLYCLQ